MNASTTGNWKIRIAEPDDWDEISRISTEIAEEGLVGNYIGDIGPRYLTMGRTLVAEDKGIVAFHNVQEVPDGSIYLSGLRVSRDFRKLGIGMLLVQSALKDGARSGKKKARAYVEPENKASLSLFTKAGFHVRKQMFLYFGSIKTEGFLGENKWEDKIVDIGHVPSEYFNGIPARLLRNGQCLIAEAEKNHWDGKPSFTIYNSDGCIYSPGDSFIVSSDNITPQKMGPLRKIDKFETAYLLEIDL